MISLFDKLMITRGTHPFPWFDRVGARWFEDHDWELIRRPLGNVASNYGIPPPPQVGGGSISTYPPPKLTTYINIPPFKGTVESMIRCCSCFPWVGLAVSYIPNSRAHENKRQARNVKLGLQQTNIHATKNCKWWMQPPVVFGRWL